MALFLHRSKKFEEIEKELDTLILNIRKNRELSAEVKKEAKILYSLLSLKIDNIIFVPKWTVDKNSDFKDEDSVNIDNILNMQHNKIKTSNSISRKIKNLNGSSKNN